MSSVNRWVLFVLLIISGFLAFSGWSFYRAAHGGSGVTDRDYYSHGLRFNQTLLEQKAAATLGWDTRISLTGRQLHVLLHDQNRQPVTTARATLILSAGGSPAPLHLALEERVAGTYSVSLPNILHGEQTARLDFERDGARLSKQLLISLP